MYVQILILPKPWKVYTILDCVDGDILQVCEGLREAGKEYKKVGWCLSVLLFDSTFDALICV